MKAGFAGVKINPPLGTFMLGFGGRDIQKGCEGIHDDLFARALYVEHDGQEALIVGYDLLFFGRDEGDRFCGALGRRLDLRPRQILLNCTHTHVGPALGSWGYADYKPLVDKSYVAQVEAATIQAAEQARRGAREVTVWSGQTRSKLPVSRRYLNAKGQAEWRPDPRGEICDALPMCLFKDAAGQPVCLLFSVSCHPSTISGYQISADYPGVATRQIDRHLGKAAGLFLQGCGGDTKADVIANGPPDDSGLATWRSGNWDDVERAGCSVAQEVIAALKQGLLQRQPRVRTFLREMHWPLGAAPSRQELEAYAKPTEDSVRRFWAKRMLERIDRGQSLPTHAPVLLQAMQLAQGLQLVALEGEPVAGFGKLILQALDGQGVTFPLGYTNSQGLYLPTERMLKEGGYEVESSYEYGFPAPLAPGYEAILQKTLGEFKSMVLN